MKAKGLIKGMYLALTTKGRGDEEIIVLADGHPEWMADAVRDAHGDMLPDDTRFRMIREVLSNLEDRVDDDVEQEDLRDHIEDARHELCDGLVDIYNSALTAWLHSHIDRLAYVTDAVGEYGRGDDVMKEIQMGQFREYEEILESIVSTIENHEEEEDTIEKIEADAYGNK